MLDILKAADLSYQIRYLALKKYTIKEIRVYLSMSLPRHRIPTIKVCRKKIQDLRYIWAR